MVIATNRKAKAVADYVSEVQIFFRTGQAGEHAYRPALKKLVELLNTELQAVNDPKQSEYGACWLGISPKTHWIKTGPMV